MKYSDNWKFAFEKTKSARSKKVTRFKYFFLKLFCVFPSTAIICKDLMVSHWMYEDSLDLYLNWFMLDRNLRYAKSLTNRSRDKNTRFYLNKF